MKSKDGHRLWLNISDIKENNPLLYGMLFTEMMAKFEHQDLSKWTQVDKFTDWNVYVDEVEPDIPTSEYGEYHYDSETYDGEFIAEVVCTNCNGDGCEECDNGSLDWNFSDGEHEASSDTGLSVLSVDDDVIKYNESWWRKYLNSDKTTPIYNTRYFNQQELDKLIEAYKDIDKLQDKKRAIAKIRDKEYEESKTRYYEQDKYKKEIYEVIQVGKNAGTNYEERILLETIETDPLGYYEKNQLELSLKAKYANKVEGYGVNISLKQKESIYPNALELWYTYDEDGNMLGEIQSSAIRYDRVMTDIKDLKVKYIKYAGKVNDEEQTKIIQNY